MFEIAIVTVQYKIVVGEYLVNLANQQQFAEYSCPSLANDKSFRKSIKKH